MYIEICEGVAAGTGILLYSRTSRAYIMGFFRHCCVMLKMSILKYLFRIWFVYKMSVVAMILLFLIICISLTLISVDGIAWRNGKFSIMAST